MPKADYFKQVIPRFHDERDEKQMSLFAALSVNTLFEQLSGELLRKFCITPLIVCSV